MYHFIVNPNSRTGKARQLWQTLEQELIRRSVPYRAYLTEQAGQAAEFARQITAQTDAATRSEDGSIKLIVVGGDGTVNEVINGMESYSNLFFGYIPTGSGNDLARGLGIQKDPLAALDRVLAPKRIQAVDHGQVFYYDGTKTRRFAVSSGIGYDADICYEALTSKLKQVLNRLRLGKLIYILLAVKQIITNRPVDVTITIDGITQKQYKKTVFIAAMIHRCEGGGLLMAPSADPTDRKLTVCMAHSFPKLKIFFLMPSIFFGRHTKLKGVELFDCTTLEVRAAEPMVLHTDGEFGGKKDHVLFSCTPKQIKMLL